MQRLDVLGIECGHGNGIGKLSFQKCLLRDIDGIDLVQDEKRRKFSGVDTLENFSRDLNVRAQRWIRCIHYMSKREPSSASSRVDRNEPTRSCGRFGIKATVSGTRMRGWVSSCTARTVASSVAT